MSNELNFPKTRLLEPQYEQEHVYVKPLQYVSGHAISPKHRKRLAKQKKKLQNELKKNDKMFAK